MSRARDERCAQLVTVVAEPGIGKSRLIAELREDLGDEVTWLDGACAPYGDANALAAMQMVIRDLIGLGAGEDGATVDDALGALIERAESAESERVWLRSRLSVLADVSREEDRDRTIPLIEVAGAAARVLAAAAADRPVVVAIEDLHWSEQALRESLSTIVDDADAPIVVLCTARPELFDADAGWGGGRSNSTTLRLVPLTDLETTTLVESLLRASILTETERDSILRNIGGNPLFAVEFVRMLVDRRLTEAEVPMSVQAVIGARLDSVSPELRTMLQDAAVVGARFWPDALLAIGDTSSAEVRGALAELSRRGLIQRSSDSWFPDQAEYAFGHALIREVAYARLPRMARATKHAAVGMWLSEEVRESPGRVRRRARPPLRTGGAARRGLGGARGGGCVAGPRGRQPVPRRRAVAADRSRRGVRADGAGARGRRPVRPGVCARPRVLGPRRTALGQARPPRRCSAGTSGRSRCTTIAATTSRRRGRTPRWPAS